MQNEASCTIVDSLDMWGFTNVENVLTPRRKTAPIW